MEERIGIVKGGKGKREKSQRGKTGRKKES